MDKSNVSECEKCYLTYFQSVCFEEDKILEFLFDHGVFKKSTNCGKCGHPCILNKKEFRFKCYKTIVLSKSKKVKCSYRKSAKVGTFFHRMKLPFSVYFKLLAVLLHTGPPRSTFIQRELGVHSATYIYFFSFCRQVFIDHIINSSSILGGPQTVVEIIVAKVVKGEYDTKNFKETWISTRTREIKGKWVIGGMQHDKRNCFLIPVQTCDANALLQVINDWISPGTTIVSDCWKKYKCFSHKTFKNLKDNEVLFFEDNITNEYSDSIDKCWHEVRGYKSRIGLLKRQKTHTTGYLAEFLFKWKYPIHAERFHYFFNSASAMCPPKY